jgi:hypothetical protein
VVSVENHEGAAQRGWALREAGEAHSSGHTTTTLEIGIDKNTTIVFPLPF